MALIGVSSAFCLPHELSAPLGTPAEFKAALAACRELGVNAIPIISCRLINPHTLTLEQEPDDWFAQNVAGQGLADNWSYHPDMIPHLPIRQIGSYAAYYVCESSPHWRQGFMDFVAEMVDSWGVRGFIFDQAVVTIHNTSGLCFNPRHTHRPDEQPAYLVSALVEARRLLRERWGDEAVLAGESLWDLCTEWIDFTWDWASLPGTEEVLAPFHMAFPRARQCLKCTDQISQINKIFTAGYWIDLYLEEGGARLGR